MKRVYATTLLTLVFLSLIGCGFHLRGDAPVAESLKTLYVQGVDLRQDYFGLELKRALQRNGITVLSEYQEGAAILTILQNRYNKQTLSIGTDAKVSEYELQSIVKFKVTDEAGQLLGQEQTVEVSRDFQFDSDQVLAMDEQERVLREDMNKHLAQSVLRRLSALK